jgi:hypothetical protein
MDSYPPRRRCPSGDHAGDNPDLRAALSCADQGWPVFPCYRDSRSPVGRYGRYDASTDPAQIRDWFAGPPERNLAVATGAPGPDVLSVSSSGPNQDGYAALSRLHLAGLLTGAFAFVKTPGDGLHVYFTGSRQHSDRLRAHDIGLLAVGGAVLAPPSHAGGQPYEGVNMPGTRGRLDWEAAAHVLEPSRTPSRTAEEGDIGKLAGWLSSQRGGDLIDRLSWAAGEVLGNDQAANLAPLADAARQAGLGDPAIQRALDTARRPYQAHLEPPDHQAEGGN